MRGIAWIFAVLAPLAGCDQIKERAGFPDPARVEAEGKAIGGACRHAGRGLEDCFRLNPEAGKSAVYAGWKEMNEYMAKNGIQAVAPTIPPESHAPPQPARKKSGKSKDEADEDTAEDGKTPAEEKDAAH